MQSHWDKLPTIRVVDAGYLLAGMEPERKWQFAPPLVKNFFNLICEKTGAVKMSTMPGERMEITKAEFLALMAEYGSTPATEPTIAPASDEVKNLADRELLAAFSETVNNGAALNWRYWVHQLPTLTNAEAARLICGLDPDLFKSLESRPNKNDQSQLCAKAAMVQRLAERQGKESARPDEWIAWADEHQISVHEGFKLEVESTPTPALAQTTATPAPLVTVGAFDGVEPNKAGPVPVEQGLLTKDVAACFGNCYYTAGNWPKRLSGTAWLETARIGRGEAGGASAVWNPLTLARLMHTRQKGAREKEKLMKTLNSRFTLNPALEPWRDAFNEYFATYCATD